MSDALPYEPAPTPERRKQTVVFALTWLAYASYYLGRKALGVCKKQLQDRYALSTARLGDIDTAFLAAYCLGQFLSGSVGDRIGSRRLVGGGMLLVAVTCLAFGLSNTAWAFFTAYLLNGLFQATGWSGTVKAMGTWFSKKQRGTVMGAWSTCYQAGGLIATAFATYLLVHFGWRFAFFGPAVVIALVGVVVLVFLPEHRSTPAQAAAGQTTSSTTAAAQESEAGPSWDILRSPAIWSLGAAYFCLKLIRYSILFWLPYYLSKVLHYSEAAAGYQSVSFEVGGMIGAIAIGAVSDKYFPGRRRTIAAIMSLALAASFVLYTQLAPVSQALNFLGMALVGFCLFGPDTLIAGAAAQDLGGRHNGAKAAGFINGLGSVGAVFQGRVTSGVSTAFGWDALFYLFVALAVTSSVALVLGRSHDRARVPVPEPQPA